MIALWTLCVLLDRSSTPACMTEGSRDACQAAMDDWFIRAHAWEKRSHLKLAAMAECKPEVSA